MNENVDYVGDSLKSLGEKKGGQKPYFGTVDKMNYAVQLNSAVGGNGFPGRGFGGVVDNRNVIKEFKNTAKKAWVGAKGKPTLPAVKKWVKENKPSEFYASWKADSSMWKDDSVEIYYKD